MMANARALRRIVAALLLMGGLVATLWARSFWFDEGLLLSPTHAGVGGVIVHRGAVWMGSASVAGRSTELINAPTSPDPDLDAVFAEFGLIVRPGACFVGVPGWMVSAAMFAGAALAYRWASRDADRSGFPVSASVDPPRANA